MPTPPRIAARVASFALLAATALAQFPSVPTPQIRRQGPFSAWPIGIALDATAPNELLRVAPAPRATPPAPIGQPGLRPDYTATSLFPFLPQVLLDYFGFSAVDTGNALLPVPSSWVVLSSGGQPFGIAPDLRIEQRWLALAASVTSGSPLASHPLLAAGQGSDLISYFFRDSFEVPTSLLGALHLEQTAGQMALPAGADIGAFDFALGMLTTNSQDDLPAFAPNADVLYYSVTPFFVLVYEAFAAGGQIPKFAAALGDPQVRVFPPDAGAVYRSTWAAGTQTWSNPVVFASRDDLGLVAGENVDAVTVDHTYGIVIFSTERGTGPQRDQVLLHHATLTPLGHLPLYEIDGTKLSTKLGLTDEDDIDGLCGTDPEIGSYVAGRAAGTPRPDRFGYLYGTDPVFNGLAEPIGFSMARDAPNGPAAYDIRLQVSGWGPFEQPVPCAVYPSMRIETLQGGAPVWGPWVPLSPVPRAAAEQTWHLPWPVVTGAGTANVRRIQVDAYVTCTDPAQWIHAGTGAVVPSTHPDATPIVGATWPLEIRF